MYQWNGMSDAEHRWNRFVDLACNAWDDETLNETQYNALQCLLYAGEVNNGGHGQYLDAFANDPERITAALTAVGGAHFAENYLRAVREGEADDWAATDGAFYAFEPSLEDCLENYVEAHQGAIFEGWEEEK